MSTIFKSNADSLDLRKTLNFIIIIRHVQKGVILSRYICSYASFVVEITVMT